MNARIHRLQTRRAVRLVFPLIALAWLVAAGGASAQPVPVPDTYGGDFWTRPRLTGDWGGLRDQMAKKGVSLDVDVLLTPQGVASGGRDTGAEFWGSADYTLGVDTGKLGLWPGGFLNVLAITGFGDPVNRKTAAILPVNTATILPAFGEQGTALLNLTFMQFLSEKFGVFAGKAFTLGGDATEFTGGYRDKFMNMGLAVNPALALFPISAYGGGIVVLPWPGAVFTVSVADPSGTPQNNDISEAFRDGVLVAAEGRVTVKPFGLVGHQLVGFGWSNKERLSLKQDPSNLARLFLTEQFPRLANPGPALERIIARFFPELLVPTTAPNREQDTWTVYYNFDQFVWSPKSDPTKGIGVFFKFGVSDGEANPIKYAFNVGIGGKGIVPGRPGDTFGIGWARTEFSDDFAPFLRKRLGLGLDREDAVEMYYNAALTGWLNASLDLQIIEPALKKVLDSSSGRLKDVDTAVVVGLRLHARF